MKLYLTINCKSVQSDVHEFDWKVFGSRLRELRKQRLMTQKQLADKVSLNFTYLSKVETGTLPPPSEDTIRKLAKALGADEDQLVILAKKVPKELRAVVTDRAGVPALLRAVRDRGLSEDDVLELLKRVREPRQGEK